MLLVVALVLSGHLVHPWSTVLCGVWVGALALAAALPSPLRSGSLRALAPVALAVAALGTFHHLDSTVNLFGPAVEPPAIAPYVTELVAARDGQSMRLDAERTIGTYSLFRMGIVCVPWLVVLASWLRELRILPIAALISLLLCFVEPVARLAALALPIDLLWRNRLMMPSVAAITAAAAIADALSFALLRRAGLRPGAAAGGAALATLVLFLAAVGLQPSKALKRDGPVEHPSKLSALTRGVAEAMGGPAAAPYLLAPSRSDIAVELPQLVPRARLVMVRPLIVDQALGMEERQRRMRLLRNFEQGRMSEREFALFRAEFPVDWALVDGSLDGALRAQDLLRSEGWRPGWRFGAFHLWQAPAARGTRTAEDD